MFAELAINLLASAVLVAGGYLWGKYRERQSQKGKRLEEFDFYPFGVDEAKVLYFDEVKFLKAVDYLLKHRNDVAVRQLLLVGQQNDVENSLSADGRLRYRRLYSRYGGDKIRDDTEKFLANYRRIVRLIGDSFPDTGIEIILHDLTNPATALSCIKNNVTGRDIGSPATNLVFDLKTRRELSQDKLNYELNIGARKFKCTTIPIFRDPDGLVGAVCINVDVNFLTDEVLSQTEKMEMFINSLCKTDMNLDENILSKDEHQKALAGKRHFRDFSPTDS
jgi:predicted transcriptional regulator YheO